METPRIGRVLPNPGSPEASAMMDSMLAEYQWPANSKNAARAGWEAANRWLASRMGAAAALQPQDLSALTDPQAHISGVVRRLIANQLARKRRVDSGVMEKREARRRSDAEWQAFEKVLAAHLAERPRIQA